MFFSTGLYKTAAIDDTVTTTELCRMIAHKVEIEKQIQIGEGSCTLFECRDTSEEPWKRSPFGTAYRVIGSDERIFDIVQGWVTGDIIMRSRFVIVVKEQNPAVVRESLRSSNKAWRPSCHLEEPLAADLMEQTEKHTEEPPQPAAAATTAAEEKKDKPTPVVPARPSASSRTANRPNRYSTLERSTREDVEPSAKADEQPQQTHHQQKQQRQKQYAPEQPSKAPASSQKRQKQQGFSAPRSSLCLAKEVEPQVVAPCLEFVNKHVEKRGLHVRSVEDLRSGYAMLVLVEQLTGKPAEPRHEHAASKSECIANWATVLRVLSECGCGIENDIPEDCYYGPQTTLVALVTLVAEHFAGNKDALAVADEVLSLIEQLQQKIEFVQGLEKQLQERENAVFKKEMELEERELAVAAKERQAQQHLQHQQQQHQGAAAETTRPSRQASQVKPPPPAPMPAGYLKRVNSTQGGQQSS